MRLPVPSVRPGPRKSDAAGIDARQTLAHHEFARREWPHPDLERVPGATPDDVVDALLLLVSATRLVEDVAHVLPEEPETDTHGLRAEVIV
jgi:predicted RNase H-like nuclease